MPSLIPALSSLPVRQQQFWGGSPIAGKLAGPFPAAGAGTLWGGRPLGRRSGHGRQAPPRHSLGPGVEQSRRGVKHRRGFAWHFCSRRGALIALRVQGGCRKDTGKMHQERPTCPGCSCLRSAPGVLPTHPLWKELKRPFLGPVPLLTCACAGKRPAQGPCSQQMMLPAGRSLLSVLIYGREVLTAAAPRAKCCIGAKIRVVDPGICRLRHS